MAGFGKFYLYLSLYFEYDYEEINIPITFYLFHVWF